MTVRVAVVHVRKMHTYIISSWLVCDDVHVLSASKRLCNTLACDGQCKALGDTRGEKIVTISGYWPELLTVTA
jgi:hypothetical protein